MSDVGVSEFSVCNASSFPCLKDIPSHWKEDRVRGLITKEIPGYAAANTAQYSDRQRRDMQHALTKHQKDLTRFMVGLTHGDTEPFTQLSDNEGFRDWVVDTVRGMTYSDGVA